MSQKNEQHQEKETKFQRNLINFPFLGFAIVILILNIAYPDINIFLALFGLFFLYNGGLLFVSFVKHYKRTMLQALILTILSGAIFGTLIYLYASVNNLF